MGCRRILFIVLALLAGLYLGLLVLIFFNPDLSYVRQGLSDLGQGARQIEWSPFIAILALAVSLLSLVNDWESTRLNKAMYRDLQQEKQARHLTITVDDAFKDGSEEYPEDLWGLKLLVNNRGTEAVFFKAVHIELIYRRSFHYRNFLHTLLHLSGYDEKITAGISYINSASAPGSYWFRYRVLDPYPDFSAQEMMEKRVYLVNWETKAPIDIVSGWDEKPYRGPDPGKKEIWMLFGYLPAAWRTDLRHPRDDDFYLESITCNIITDVQTYEVEGWFAQSSSIASERRRILDGFAQRHPVQ